MGANKLMPVAALAALLVVALALFRPGPPADNGRAGAGVPAEGPRSAPQPDADTPADTLRSLAVQLQEVQSQAEAARQDSERLRTQQAEEIGRLRAEMQAREQRTEQARSAEAATLARQFEDLGRRMAPPSPPLPPSGGSGASGSEVYPVAPAAPALTWVEPLSGRAPAGPGTAPAALVAAPAPAEGPLLQEGGAPALAAPKPAEPAYTVPRNATLLGSTSLTALIGRVPIKGAVEDPFPFKVLAGRDNLAANGLEIPGVYGMVFAGVAFGDWTLGCVRGHVDSVTFVFDDGTIRTLAADSQGGSAGTATPGGAGGMATATGGGGGAIRRGLGWISDRRGIPCISGQRISNAMDYLGGRMLARGLETAGEAYARSQQTINTTPLGGYTHAVTGDPAKYAIGETVSGSSDELAKFIAERQAQMFDVVYVDTGVEVAVHLDRELRIDYEPAPAGRKLDYARASHPSRSTGRGGLD
jgi:hypothetical protein